MPAMRWQGVITTLFLALCAAQSLAATEESGTVEPLHQRIPVCYGLPPVRPSGGTWPSSCRNMPAGRKCFARCSSGLSGYPTAACILRGMRAVWSTKVDGKCAPSFGDDLPTGQDVQWGKVVWINNLIQNGAAAHKEGYTTFINNCKDNNVAVPLRVGRLFPNYTTPRTKLSYGQAIIIETKQISAQAFMAWPMPWQAVPPIPCPVCDLWTDLGSSTKCGWEDPCYTGTTCQNPKISSMWDTNNNAERARVIAYCSPENSGRQWSWNGIDGMHCGPNDFENDSLTSNCCMDFPNIQYDVRGLMAPTIGTRWEVTRDSGSNQDFVNLSTNYQMPLCETDYCLRRNVCPDHTKVQAGLPLFYNLPIRIDTSLACTLGGDINNPKSRWTCEKASCTDAFQVPTDPTALWACNLPSGVSSSDSTWYTVTYCPGDGPTNILANENST